MFSSHKTTNRFFALLVFIISLALYLSTMAPTTSFWDAGEFIAVAHGLQVNHPPGAPLYTLLGRIFSMFMPLDLVAESVNFISVLSSSLTVMLLYLIIVRLVQEFKGDAELLGRIDKIAMYGGAVIGALAFSVTDTFWFNAVEAEVYALSMFFTSMVVWLALKWAENADEKYNERWLILIAYLFGLAIGVHLLNLLTLFFVALIIYFKKYEFSIKSLLITAGISIVAFLAIYPFTIFTLPDIALNVKQATYGLIGPITFFIIIVAILGWAIWFTHHRGKRLANIVLICYAMILIGFSSYALIPIRSLTDPPIDENDPETVESFISYLKREQYGSTPLLTGYTYDDESGRIDRSEEVFFPRRYSWRGSHLQQYANYSSDWDYFLEYQLDHMYIRYFSWNFIGRESDIQGAGWQAGFTESEFEDNPAHNSYFYLPFLLGLFGLLFHFQRDWKRALAVLTLFIMTGAAIIVFLNQTPLQPRERDYAYVGSFFAFSIWIGLGATGIVTLIKEHLTKNKFISLAAAGILFAAVPLLMGLQNYNDSDRSTNYVPADYAYNLLMSVDPNAILFTNGDNDTFPLWYLQEVKGVRTDVRIVCLSLLNTEWYIKQLRDQWSHEAPPVPISLSNAEIEKLTSGVIWNEPGTITVAVKDTLLKRAFSNADVYLDALDVTGHPEVSVYDPDVDFGIPVDSLDDNLSWYYKGRAAGVAPNGQTRYYSRVQDKVVINIIKTNNWLRPVYFATTVSRQSQLSLQHYLRMEGQALRLVPQYHEDISMFGWIDPEIMASKYRKFRFRRWNDPGTYLNANIRRMLGNYRLGITELAGAYLRKEMPDSAAKWLAWGEEHIPFRDFVDNTRLIMYYALQYAKAAGLADTTLNRTGIEKDTTAFTASDIMANAIRLAERGGENAFENLRQVMNRISSVRAKIKNLQSEIEQARMNANLERGKQLTQQIKDLIAKLRNNFSDISQARSQLIMLQHIYYLAGKEQKAENVAAKFKQITGGRYPFPQTREENKKLFEKFGL